MTIATLMQVFSVLLVPAAVDLARRQKRLWWLDGMLLVWTVVVGAAVLWTILVGLAFGERLTPALVAQGLLCGLVACVERWMRTGKGRSLLPEVDPPIPDAPVLKPSAETLILSVSDLPRPPLSSASPSTLTLPKPEADLDFSRDPKPSERP